MELKENKEFMQKIKIDDYSIAYRDFQLGKYPDHIFSMISLMRLSLMFKEEGFIYFEINKGNRDKYFLEKINEDILEFELIKTFVDNVEKFLVPDNIVTVIEKMDKLLEHNESKLL